MTVANRLETPRAAGVAGLLFSALFVASLLLVRARPAPGSAPRRSRTSTSRTAGESRSSASTSSRSRGSRSSGSSPPFRSHLGDREDRFFATVLLGSGHPLRGDALRGLRCGGSARRRGEVPRPASSERRLRSCSRARSASRFSSCSACASRRCSCSWPRRSASAPASFRAGSSSPATSGGLVFLFTVTYVELLALLLPAWVTAVSVVILRAAGSPTRDRPGSLPSVSRILLEHGLLDRLTPPFASATALATPSTSWR